MMRQNEDRLYSSYIVNCALNAFSCYTAITLNILTIHAMRKTSSLPAPLKALLLSLAVSDLCVGLLVQPFYIALLVKLLQQNTTDNLSYPTEFIIITGLFSDASFLGVMAISVDRFLAIHLHLRYQELVTHKRVVAVVISIWILSAFLSSIWLWIPVVVAAIISGLCFICTTVVYYKIYVAVRHHTNQIHALQVQQVAQHVEMVNVARLRKSAFSTFYVYLVFLFCYLPRYCFLVAFIISGPSLTTNLNGLLLYSWTLVFLNSSINPVIYCWKIRHIRLAIIDLLRRITPSQN
ncbi:melanocyte-stimulating hormone receptor-like [Oculina patagonica]